MDKLTRLFKALLIESRHRLPYIFLVIAIIFLGQFIKLTYKTAEGVQIAKDNSTASKTLLTKVADLSADNKKLAEQNNQLAHENAAHIDCIATLFARYTRDHEPITLIDINTCQALVGQAPTTSPGVTTKSNNNTNPPVSTNKNPTPQKTSIPKSPQGQTKTCLFSTHLCIRWPVL